MPIDPRETKVALWRIDGETVKVVVGEERREYAIHKNLICERCSFFEKATREEWKEGQEKTVPLPDDEPEVFELYAHWMYCGKIFSHDSAAESGKEKASEKCLRGMCQGLPLDPRCPNVATHGCRHIQPRKLLQLVREQLAIDRGKDADCCALYKHGSRGALLKIRLTSHGYTMVAKGVETRNLRPLQQEKRIYDRLKTLQGKYVPVCCGASNLKVPYYYDRAELTHLLLMSWAGKSLTAVLREDWSAMQVSEDYIQLCKEALLAIHRKEVLHHDVEPRNMLYNSESQTLMLVDFERSELRRCQALCELSPNRKRERSSDHEKTAEVDCFKREVSLAEFNMNEMVSVVY